MNKDRLKTAILISGRGSNLTALIQQATNVEICLVLANKAARGLDIAEQYGLSTILLNRSDFPDKASHEKAVAKEIEKSSAHWICLAGYMAVLSADFIARFEGRIINIHPSLLPAYKGLDTHQRAITDGAVYHGVSVHLVTTELDGGPIIAQMRLMIDAQDDAVRLAERVLVLEHQIYPLVMNALASGNLVIEGQEIYWKQDKADFDLGLAPHTQLFLKNNHTG